MTDKLLHRIVESRAKWVLVILRREHGRLDDGRSPDRVGEVGAAIGCRCILTGIGPEIAQTLVALTSLGDLRPMRSPGRGLSSASGAPRERGRSAGGG
jgi:hypothetical protein